MTLRALSEWLETAVAEVLRGRRASRYDQTLKAALFVLSRLYRRAVLLRLHLYRQRLFREQALGCLVVSIGNLTVGGTGKTPVVEVFSRTLTQQGRKVAILSRGYRSRPKPWWQRLRETLWRRGEAPPPRVVSDGRRLLLDSESAGDEPYMLASNLKDVVVLVDPDRVKSGRHAIRHYDCDTLILDDGFQYLALRPRINILLVDSTDPFHNHHLLPRGFLREPIANVRRADFIFLTKSNGGSHLRHLKRYLMRRNPRAEIIECTHRPRHLQDVYSHERRDLEVLRGKRLAALSGIAAPEGFEAVLEGLGGRLVHRERFADHHRYTQQEVIDFINAAMHRDAELVVTTEKDAVRFPMLDRRDLPVLFLRVEIDILSGQESFDEAISRICLSPVLSRVERLRSASAPAGAAVVVAPAAPAADDEADEDEEVEANAPLIETTELSRSAIVYPPAPPPPDQH